MHYLFLLYCILTVVAFIIALLVCFNHTLAVLTRDKITKELRVNWLCSVAVILLSPLWPIALVITLAVVLVISSYRVFFEKNE